MIGTSALNPDICSKKCNVNGDHKITDNRQTNSKQNRATKQCTAGTSRSDISRVAGASGFSPVSRISIPSFATSFSRKPTVHTRRDMYNVAQKQVRKLLKICIFSTKFKRIGWRRRSEVRTSVFGQQTFTALHRIYSLQLCLVKCPLWVSQPGQLSHPSLLE